VYLSAGDGGDGSNGFRREKFVPLGGPSGGDGGNGGSVYLVGDAQVDSLLDLYYRPHQKAEHGVKGLNRDCHGKNGKDLIIKVPCGTVIHDHETNAVMGEIVDDGEMICVAKGGQGGLGNKHFITSSNQAPTDFTVGEEGIKLEVWLELKSIADIGLVGYPNAGKSTLLTAMTNAHPKIGAYPFTTLNPIIGTWETEDYKKIRIADIPGLIEGAHEGIGLGHDFLRHIERTKFLLFVLDMGGEDGRSPLEDYRQLKDELRLYNEELENRPYLIVANKMDAPDSGKNLKELIRETGEKPIEVCAALKEGMATLKAAILERITNEEDL